MDADQKKLIEETLKSDYFNRSLEIEIQKKAFEILKRYKWIGALIALIIVLINAYFGIEIKDFYKSKMELEKSAQELKSEAARLQQFYQFQTEKASLREEIEIERDKVNAEKAKFQEEQFKSIKSDAENAVVRNQAQIEELKEISESISADYNSLNSEVEGNLSALNKDRVLWEEKSWQIVRNSSTIFAYVERGGEEGDWDYHPKTFILPYSSNKIKLIFKKYDEKDTTEANGEKRNYKVATVIMQVTDPNGGQIFDGALYLSEHSPEDIPNTEHQITLNYVYTPPNIHGLAWPFIGIIPDFAVLGLSLKNPDTFLNVSPGMTTTGD